MKNFIKTSIAVILFGVSNLSAQADLDRGLIAHYPLDSNGVNYGPHRLANTDFVMHQISYNYGFEGPARGLRPIFMVMLMAD